MKVPDPMYEVIRDRNKLPESNRWIVHNTFTGKDVMAFESKPEAEAMAKSLSDKMRGVFSGGKSDGNVLE